MPDPMTPERLFEIRVQRSTARACKTVDAVAVFEAVDDLLAEVTRLRPMEAGLDAVRELHQPIDNTWALAPGDGSCCEFCCVDGHGARTPYCKARCEAVTACWPCPTRAALDGGA